MISRELSGLRAVSVGVLGASATHRSVPAAILLIVSMLFSIAFVPAHAQVAIAGVVKAAELGTAVSVDGRERVLKPGDAVYAGERIRTGKNGGVALTMRDDTRIALGPDTSLVVQSFVYDASKQQGNMTVSVLRGVTALVSGLLAKNSPDAVRVVTPTVTAGVRGTEFIIEVEGGSDE